MGLDLLRVTLEEGLAYAILALGVYITYSILDFPDLSVDGTMPFGAVVSAVLITLGCDPWLSCLAAFVGGALCGCVTGVLHVKLGIRPLLCGILVMTGLISVNMVVMMGGTDGRSLVSLLKSDRIFNAGPVTLLPERIGDFPIRTLAVTLVLAVVCKLLMDWFLKTKAGLLLRATGSNQQYVNLLARDPGVSKILGLALGNGLAALAGAIIAQNKKSADLQMGTGMVVLGLASVIIGLSLFGRVRFLKPTTKVILGALLYKACLSVALALGLDTAYNKLLMVVLFTIVLVGGRRMPGRKGKGAASHAEP